MLKHQCELRFCTLVINVPQIEAFELILVAAHKICRPVFMDSTFYCEAFTVRFLGVCEVMLDNRRKKITCRGVKRLAGKTPAEFKQLVARKYCHMTSLLRCTGI